MADNKAIPSPVCCDFVPQFTLGGNHGTTSVRTDLNKYDEKQGFQFTVHNIVNSAQAIVWILSCTRNRMFEHKAGDAQFAEGMKVTTVEENHRVDHALYHVFKW
jgi:hypothetical protein